MRIETSDYQRLIESGFDIVDKRGQRMPFLLNDVQRKYLRQIISDYHSPEGIRENVLKARQEGFSALIDAVLTVDFLTGENVGAQIISHKEKETEILIRRVNFFIDSFCEKRKISRKDLLKTDRQEFLENKANGSYLFIGTAGAKTLGRGGTLQNIHWSEVGFFPNTEVLNAERLVTAAEQQVAVGVGKVFRESTGNMMGDFFHRECERARKGDSAFRFRFYSWFENPDYRMDAPGFSPSAEEREMMVRYNLTSEQMAWYREKAREYETRALFLREYPTTPEEAFLASGAGYFDPDVLKTYHDAVRAPLKTGMLAADGGWI